jgi:hypothetical protein
VGSCLVHAAVDAALAAVAAAAPAEDVRDLVAVYKNPPYPIFYDVVYHSFGLVPMLASPLYYSSKFSSTVLTSFITGKASRGRGFGVLRGSWVPDQRLATFPRLLIVYWWPWP